MKIGTRQQALGKSQKKFFAYRFARFSRRLIRLRRLRERVKITSDGVNSASQRRRGS
jgi:hypothetical protein